MVNNKKVIITIYDDDIIISFSINDLEFSGMSTMNNSDYIDIVEKIHKKLLRNPIKNIENHEYKRNKQNDILEINFEIIPDTVIIRKNSINSIIKIIDNVKLVITVFDDNMFVTKIKDNILNTSSTFHINIDINNYDKSYVYFDFKNLIKYDTKGNFSQTEKKVFSQHYSDMQEACNPNYVPVKPNDEPVKPNDETVKPNDETVKPNDETVKPNDEPVKPNDEPVKPNDEPVKPKNDGCILQ